MLPGRRDEFTQPSQVYLRVPPYTPHTAQQVALGASPSVCQLSVPMSKTMSDQAPGVCVTIRPVPKRAARYSMSVKRPRSRRLVKWSALSGVRRR